jgi:hypothetical protein
VSLVALLNALNQPQRYLIVTKNIDSTATVRESQDGNGSIRKKKSSMGYQTLDLIQYL